MYRCNFCYRIFDEPESKKVETGVESEGVKETFEVGVCPACKTEDEYEEVVECKCGEYDSEPVCISCQIDALKAVERVIHRYAETKEQVEFLKEMIAEAM